jgi:cytochrome c peroxidase
VCRVQILNKDNHVPLEGAYKVPGLRNVAATAPCMHDGRFVDLETVLDFYPHPPDKEQGRQHELPELDITDAESHLLAQFLKSLSVVRG